MRKTFVLDTNVLLHNPESLTMFADNVVVLPISVLEELDGFKTHNDELGRNARHVIRQLDKFRTLGSLRSGVEMPNGGMVKIMVGKELVLKTGLEKKFADNYILSVAYHLHTELGDKGKVIFVSKDINCRVKASALGIEAQDFESEKVNTDLLYTGLRVVPAPAGQVDAFYRDGRLELDVDVYPNECVLLRDEGDEKHSACARATGKGREIVALGPQAEDCYGIRPRNSEQRFALDLLTNPSVSIVTLVGGAGTGKTLLALAAGMEQVLKGRAYTKILVTRPIIPLGKDLGFLPGSKDNKMALWMQPIFDNLSFLLANGETPLFRPAEKKPENPGKSQGKTASRRGEFRLVGSAEEPAGASAKRKADELLANGDIELEALTYIRGRSIPQQYIIVDEAQNLTPHEVKTIISRAGDGSKIVLTGDPEQIDNPYLDAESNGLCYAVERLKNSPLHGHIILRKSERSALAGAAAALL